MKRFVALMLFVVVVVGMFGPRQAKAGPESAVIWAGILVTSMTIGGCASMAATAKPDLAHEQVMEPIH